MLVESSSLFIFFSLSLQCNTQTHMHAFNLMNRKDSYHFNAKLSILPFKNLKKIASIKPKQFQFSSVCPFFDGIIRQASIWRKIKWLQIFSNCQKKNTLITKILPNERKHKIVLKNTAIWHPDSRKNWQMIKRNLVWSKKEVEREREKKENTFFVTHFVCWIESCRLGRIYMTSMRKCLSLKWCTTYMVLSK